MKKIIYTFAFFFMLHLFIQPVRATPELKLTSIPNSYSFFRMMYLTNGKNIFYNFCQDDETDCVKIMPAADAKTFVVVTDENPDSFDYAIFAKDKNHVFAWDKILKNADPKSLSS